MEEVKPIAADGGASSEDALTADGFVCQNKNHSGDAKTKKENPNDEANSNHAKEEKPTERQSNDESIGKNSNHDKRDNDKNNETNVKNSNHDKETAKPIGKNSDKAVVKISNLDKINAGEHSLDQCDSHEAIGDGQQPIGDGQQAVGDNQQAAGAGQQNAGEQLPGDYEDQPQDPGQQLPGGGDNNQPNDNGNGEEEEGEEDNNVEEEEEDGDEEEEEEDVEPQADAEGGNNENGAEGGNNQNVAEGGNNQIEGNGNNDPPVMEIDCGGAGDIGVPLHLESLHIYGPHGDGPHHIEEEEGIEEDDEDDNDFANDNDIVEQDNDGPPVVGLQQEGAQLDVVEGANDGPQVVGLQQEVAPPDVVEEADDGPQIVELQQEVAPPDEVEEADDGPQVVELQQEVAPPDEVEGADDGPQVVELQQEVAQPDVVEEADDGPQVVELQQEVAPPDMIEEADDGPQVVELQQEVAQPDVVEGANDGPQVDEIDPALIPLNPLEEAGDGPHVHVFEEDEPPHHNAGPHVQPDVPPLHNVGPWGDGLHANVLEPDVPPLPIILGEADNGFQIVGFQQGVAPLDVVEEADDGPQVVELQQEVAPPDVVEEADNGPQVVELQEEVAPPDVVEGADDGPQVVELQQEVAPPDEVEGAVDGPQVVELQQEVAPPDVVEGANDGPQVDEIDPALIPLNPLEEAGDGPHVHVFEEDEPPHHNAGPHVQPPLHNVGPWGDGLHANVFVPDVPPHHNAGPGDDPQVGEGQNNEEDDNSDNDEDDDHEDDIMVDPPEPDNEGNDQPPEPDNGAGGMAGGHGGIEGGEDIVGGADMGAGGEIEGGGGMGAGNNMAGNDQNQANENEEKPLQDCQNDVDVDINAAKHLKEYVKKLDSTKVCETKMKTNENECEMKTLEDVSLDEKHTSKSSKVEPQSLKNKADKLPSNKPLNSDIENISLDEKHTSESSKSESKVELQSLQNKVDESPSELLNSDVEDFSLNEKHTTESSNSESKVEPHSLQTEVDKLPSNESLNSDSKILDSLAVQAPHINSSDKILSVENPVLDIAIPANKEPVDCDNPAEEERFVSNVEVKEKSPSSQLCVDDDSTLNSDKPSVKNELNSKNPVVFFEFPANNEPMDCDNPVEEEQSVSSVKSKDKSHSSQICVNDDSMKNSYEPTVKIELNAIDKIPENDSSIDRNKSTSEVNKTSESIQDDTNMNNSAELILKKDQNLEELAASPAEDSTVENSKQSTEDVKNETETKQEESKVEKQYRQTDNAEKYGVEAVEAPKDTTTNSSIQDVDTALKTDNGEAEIKTEKQMADNYSEEKVGEAVEASKDCTTLSTQDDDADTVIKTDDNGEEENKAAKPDEQIDNNAEKFGEAVETSKDTTATSSIHDVNADSDLKTGDHGEEENKADKQTGNNAEAVEASKDLKTDEHGEEGSKTEKPDEQIDNDSEDKIGEAVEASKDCTTLSTQDDADSASKTDENGEDMRQPIVNLEKLQSPLVERTSVSLATCELCEGACPTQQCLRLRRNSGSGRVTRRGRGRPRLNAELPTENTTYTCLLCRKVMPDRQSSRKHVRTSHDIVCSTCSGVFPDCNALNEHRTKDKCGNAEQIQQCEGEGEQDAEWKLPTRRVADGAGGVCDLLGTLFASDNDDDSPSDDQDSDFTCDDHEIEEAEKEEDLDVKKNDSRRKSLRNYRTRQGKQDETLIVGKRSFRLTKNSTIHKLVAGSKNISQRNKCIGNVESTVALTKRGTPIPLRVLRKTLLENNGNLSAFGRGRNAGSSVLVTCSSSKEDENDSKDDDTISLRSGNSVSRGENSISLRSSMRISSKSNDEVDDGEDDEDDDSGLCDNLGSNSELNQSQSAGRVKCDHCGSTYSTKSNLQRHIANHCRALNGVDKDSRKKKADDLKRKKLRKYYNTDAKRSRRSYGSSSESSSSDNDMDMETQTDGGAKTQRDKGTSTTGLVYSPRLILHRIDNGKVNSIAADQKSESDEVVNISETDKSIQVGQGECNIKSAKNFRCTECRRSFYTQDDLSLHGMIHTNRTDFPCPRCNKIFPTFPNLRVHMRTHATGPPCLCDVCGKAFNTPSSLKVHMKTHDDDEKFNCSYCNRTFNFVGNLKVHERLHTGEKPYKCSLCERCFTQSTSLKLHVQSLHMQQRIPLPCDKCCRKFRSKETLERHKLCHVDYRRFKCDICDSVSFNNRAGLKHHMETKHLCTDGGAVVDSVQDHNSTSVAKLPSISVLGVKSSINSVADSGQNLSARFNPHGAGLTNQQNSNNVPSTASKSSSGPHNNQFCINGHNLSTIPIECNDYCKGTVLNQGGFNMDASRGSATSDACNNFNNSTPLKDKIEGTSSDLSSGTVGDNRNLLVNKTGFGNISPINSSITGIKNNICPPQYNVAMSSRGSMGRGRGSRGGRGRGGASFNYQNFLPHKCGACAARFDKKVSLRRHIKESHSGPFGDVNESLMQLQNDLEDLQRIYGNKNVDNNRQGAGAGRRKSVDGRKQSTDLESGFDESGRTDTPQPDSNKPETTFTSSFNVESLLSKSPGDGDAKAGVGTSAGGESSVESKSADLDSSSNTDNFNELEGGKVDDEAAKSGKTRTKYEFGCHLCDKSFPTTMGLVRHKNFVHKVPSERCRLPMRDKPFECEYCTKRFTFETGAQKHIQRHIEKGHSKRVKKEKVIRKPSANHQNYPSTSGVSSSSYSAPPSVDSAAYAAQHQLPNVGTLPTSTRPTSLPSFKWNFNPSDPNPSLPPINHNHVYDPYHNNPNSWAAINQKPNFYKNHTYDKTLYPTSTTSHNEFGYVGNDTFSKPVGVTPSLFSHNNTNLYPGATSYSESAASKTSSSFSVPTSYNDVTSSTYAHTSQPVQSTSTYVTQEFMPKTSTDNDYTYSSAPFVGSSLLPPVTSYSGDKAEPSAAFTDNQTDSYFKQDTDYSNAPSTSYETKIAPTFEPKMTQNVGSEQQFMFNNTTDDSSYMKNVFHAAHLLEASNYEKTYYNLDSNKFKNDSAYNQPTAAAESSYSLTRLDGYATSPSPSAVKPASPYYDTPLLKPPNKDEHFNYYKSYQYPEMAPTPGQTDTNNEWPGMMYNNL